jgi:ABC-type phosphate/phosphonate transport system ATPase subunit
MLKLIIGVKGTGKTKALINMVNTAVENSQGNVVCIEKGAVRWQSKMNGFQSNEIIECGRERKKLNFLQDCKRWKVTYHSSFENSQPERKQTVFLLKK